MLIQQILSQFGAVSATVAEQNGYWCEKFSGDDWGLSITGIAGPTGGTDTKPVGLVYLGLAGPGQEVTSVEYKFGTMRDRSSIRHLSTSAALDYLRRRLINNQTRPS